MKLYKIFSTLILTVPFLAQAQYMGGDGRGDISILLTNTPLIVEEVTNFVPTDYVLKQNYPNPFNPETKISWQSPIGSWQTLIVYDLLGNEVATLVNEYRPAGKYEVQFNTSSIKHQPSSGVYLYRITVANYTAVKKMLLLK